MGEEKSQRKRKQRMKSILILAVLTYAEYQSGKFSNSLGLFQTFFREKKNYIFCQYWRVTVKMVEFQMI